MQKIFDISLDALSNDDVEDEIISKGEVLKYQRKLRLGISLCAALITFGFAVFAFFAFLDRSSLLIGVISLLTLSIVGIVLTTIWSIQYVSFKKDTKWNISVTKQEIRKLRDVALRNLIIGIVLIFIGAIALVIMALANSSSAYQIGVSSLLTCVSISLFIILYEGLDYFLQKKFLN